MVPSGDQLPCHQLNGRERQYLQRPCSTHGDSLASIPAAPTGTRSRGPLFQEGGKVASNTAWAVSALHSNRQSHSLRKKRQPAADKTRLAPLAGSTREGVGLGGWRKGRGTHWWRSRCRRAWSPGRHPEVPCAQGGRGRRERREVANGRRVPCQRNTSCFHLARDAARTQAPPSAARTINP